ncbi:hypothetical protein PAXRUDRAFT_790281, partial [Paxillus rubicundulus Ve08.2h10]
MDGEEFFVMGVIVELQSGEGPGVESDGKDASDGIVKGIGLNNDRGIWHPMSKNWSGGEGFFQVLESRPAFVREVPQSIFLGEAGEWNNNVGIIKDEA